MHLTYRRHIPADELLGRLLGPDTVGAYVQVVEVEHPGDDVTRARCRPVARDELSRIAYGQCGQPWLPLPGQTVANVPGSPRVTLSDLQVGGVISGG